MKAIPRSVQVYGEEVTLPTGVIRIDSADHVGWQADAEGGWKYFCADKGRNLAGSLSALALVCVMLKERLKGTPPDSSIRKGVRPEKKSDLPVGITQVERKRKTRVQDEWYYVVHVPIFGRKARNRMVYVGIRSTVTKRKVAEALEKAVRMRGEGVATYLRAELAYKRGVRIQRIYELRDFTRKLRARIKEL